MDVSLRMATLLKAGEIALRCLIDGHSNDGARKLGRDVPLVRLAFGPEKPTPELGLGCGSQARFRSHPGSGNRRSSDWLTRFSMATLERFVWTYVQVSTE